MLDEKKIKEIKVRVPALLAEGRIHKSEEYKKQVGFFKENALDALNSAALLLEVSVNPKIAEQLGFPKFRGYLWTINSSYYSMFYVCHAALASIGIKIKAEIGVHKITFDTFVYYFYLTGRITKDFVEELLEAQEESRDLLSREDMQQQAELKAQRLVDDLVQERSKRREFTYELSRERIETKAKTSLERARNFFREIIKTIPT